MSALDRKMDRLLARENSGREHRELVKNRTVRKMMMNRLSVVGMVIFLIILFMCLFAPLFTPDMFVYYDRYTDGDDYQDETYARNFRNIVTAIREKKNLLLEYESRDGSRNKMTVTPQYLEYSEKDDRFRLFARGKYRHWILNLSRIKECSLEAAEKRMPGRAPAEQALRFELTDHRNAMERVLLHFSHLRKETKRLDEKHYQVTLYYDRQDETEMVIRLLSFGPVIRVTEPERIVQQLRERIERQGKLADAPGSGE